MTVFYTDMVSAGPQAPALPNASAMMAKSAVRWSSVRNSAAITRSRNDGSAAQNVQRKKVKNVNNNIRTSSVASQQLPWPSSWYIEGGVI